MGFAWGIILYRIKDRFVEILNKDWIKKSILLCVASGITGIAYLQFKPIHFFGDYLLKIILGILIILFMLALNVKISVGNRVSNYIGSISYEVYLIHGLAFQIVEKIKPDMLSGLFVLSSLIVTLIISSVAKKINVSIIQTLEKLI